MIGYSLGVYIVGYVGFVVLGCGWIIGIIFYLIKFSYVIV